MITGLVAIFRSLKNNKLVWHNGCIKNKRKKTSDKFDTHLLYEKAIFY